MAFDRPHELIEEESYRFGSVLHEKIKINGDHDLAAFVWTSLS